MPIISPTAISPHRIGGKSWLSYWTQLINAWQGAGDDVLVAGNLVSNYPNVISFLPVVNGHGNTHINKGYAIRQNCSIKAFVVDLHDFTVGAQWKFKVFRWSIAQSSYECIFSYTFTPTTPGAANTITLPVPFAALEGDVPGIYMPADNYNRVRVCSVPARATPGIGYVADMDVLVGEFNAMASSVEYNMNLGCYSNRPYAVFLGDSIFGGGNSYDAVGLEENWHTDQENDDGYHTPGGMPGDINLSVPYRFGTRMPNVFQRQNFGKGGNTFATTISAGQLDFAVGADPKAVFIHCGVNDVAAGRTTGQVNADLDTIRAAFPAGTQFYMDEILPWQCSDALAIATRAMNTNFAAYCTTNGWTLIECHDLMGVVRPSTGEYDDLNPIYSNGDSVHLNLAGADKLADIMASYLNL